MTIIVILIIIIIVVVMTALSFDLPVVIHQDAVSARNWGIASPSRHVWFATTLSVDSVTLVVEGT